MKHKRVFINISEWINETSERNPVQALSELTKYLLTKGYRSLENELSMLLNDFTGKHIDQIYISRNVSKEDDFVFTTCLKKDNVFWFLDVESNYSYNLINNVNPDSNNSKIEQIEEEKAGHQDFVKVVKQSFFLEADIFASNSKSLNESFESLIDETMRSFGLTQSKDVLVHSVLENWKASKKIKQRLRTVKPIDESLFQRLREETERSILRELKKRGSILEQDLSDFKEIGVEVEQIRKTLDYFSGEEFKLINRKYAIVCSNTNEIIFLLKSKADITGAKNLECLKCSRKIGDEKVVYYYEITDNLKKLLDGNRWMPLLIRDSLIKAGVPKEDIFTEVKHGEDEIDLLVCYRKKIFVMEVKNRPINLSDAYKLSAKTSRIESIATRELEHPNSEESIIHTRTLWNSMHFESEKNQTDFIPVVITTHDVAKDAKDLLIETKDSTQILENCVDKTDIFFEQLIDNININEFSQRLKVLTSIDKSDSISKLAAICIDEAFAAWRETKN